MKKKAKSKKKEPKVDIFMPIGEVPPFDKAWVYSQLNDLSDKFGKVLSNVKEDQNIINKSLVTDLEDNEDGIAVLKHKFDAQDAINDLNKEYLENFHRDFDSTVVGLMNFNKLLKLQVKECRIVLVINVLVTAFLAGYCLLDYLGHK